jgi:hypothetical protein
MQSPASRSEVRALTSCSAYALLVQPAVLSSSFANSTMESLSTSFRVRVRRKGPLPYVGVELELARPAEGVPVDLRPLKMPPKDRKTGRRRGSDAVRC